MKARALRLTASIAVCTAVACSEPVGPDIDEDLQPARVSAQLVECPIETTQSATAVIGILGGTIQLGGHALIIPAGALLLPTPITLTEPASQYVEIDVQVDGLEHFEFELPVVMRISYARCKRADLLRATLSAWYIDSETYELLENMGGVDDKLTGSITFSTLHFSGYAIAD